MSAFTLNELPQELLLRILLYLDLPDLTALARTSSAFRALARDRVLHRLRLLVVAPSRLRSALWTGRRPTVADLVQRGFMRGLGIERRWRAGHYFYSPQSVKQYETSQRLQKTHVCQLLASHLGGRSRNALELLCRARVLPDIESSSPRVSRSLLPTVRRLKWCIQRDSLAKKVREKGGLKEWLEDQGRLFESERVRLAICPGVRKIVGFWERQAGTQ